MKTQDPLDTLLTDSMVRCTHEECRKISSGPEVKENDGKCPHCGTRLSKPTKRHHPKVA